MEWLNVILQGLLLGGLYAMFATGLSIIFGVMRMVNIAHGDLIVAAAYIALVVVQVTGLNPFLALVAVVPIMAIVGYGLQRFLFNPTLGRDLLPTLLVAFGLSVMLQSGLQQIFTADNHRLNAGGIEMASLALAPGLTVGILPLLVFTVAVAMIAGLEFIFGHTALGRAFRATSDDAEIAQVMGLGKGHIQALAMALSAAVIAVAGVFLAIRTNFDPASGPTMLLFGFEAVIIGGLGNLWGTLAGGMVLGISQALGAQLSPAWPILTGHLVFFAVLALRPRGLFPRMDI